MKVAGKIRCSTSKQDLESQRYALTEWAKRNNHEIVLFEEFAVSGKKGIEQRQGLQDLMVRIDNKEFEALAVVEISRLGRSLKTIYEIVDKLTKLGVKIILVNSNTTLDYNTLEGKALIGGLALASEIEWCLIQERNKRGREKIKRDKIKVGRKPSEEKNINLQAVLDFKQQGKGIRETARLLNTSAPTIMRMLRRYHNAQLSNVTNSNQNGIKTNQNSGGVTLQPKSL
ncbi:recombinase family protein [Candidatus Pacearchaeota archaeon]|nr:recombinase family protein [Candidatus Pacearchaeota archaeon]